MESKPIDQFNLEAIKDFKLSMKDLLKQITEELQRLYPNSCLAYFGTENTHPAKKTIFGVCGGYGKEQDIKDFLVSLMEDDKQWNGWLSEAYLRWVMYMDISQINNQKDFIAMREAHIRYAESAGLDVTNFRELQPARKTSIHTMGQTVEPTFLEQHITEVKKELQRLEEQRKPLTIVTMLKAEVKRLKKAGELETAKAKEVELNKIIAQEEHAAKRRVQLIEQAKHMNEVKKINKAKREQAERDRNRQQFNPHAAAKAKAQKIRERQAERKASKKKASETKQWVNAPISSVIARL